MCPCARSLSECQSRWPAGLLRKVCLLCLGQISMRIWSHGLPCSLSLDLPFAVRTKREHPNSNMEKFFITMPRIQRTWFREQYLIETPESDAANHHCGVQADAFEKACTLQSYIWATSGWGLELFYFIRCRKATTSPFVSWWSAHLTQWLHLPALWQTKGYSWLRPQVCKTQIQRSS